MVSMPAVYSVDPSLNPGDVYCLSVKFVFQKNENKQKKAEVGTFF